MLLAIELTVLYQMCDLHFKIEEDRTKSTVAIENEMYFGQTDGRTDRQTDRQTDQVILHVYLSDAMHCIGQTTIKIAANHCSHFINSAS